MAIKRLYKFLKPAGDDGADTSGTGTADAGAASLDRGDDFAPSDAERALESSADATDPGTSTDAAKASGSGGDDAGDDKDKNGLKKDNRIPLSRHKEILERERAQRQELQKQLESFKQGRSVAETNAEITKLENDVLGFEKEYSQLMADGKIAEATAMMGKIRATERQIIESKGEMRTQAAEARAYERVRYDAVVDRLEQAYPVLDQSHQDYDQTKVEDLLDLKEAYQMKGMAPADALQKAAKVLLGVETAKQTRAVETDVRVDKDDVRKAVATERRAAAVDKNVNTKQPPVLAKVGVDSDKLGGGILTAKEAVKLSQEAFAKLDEKDLARMRGDDI